MIPVTINLWQEYLLLEAKKMKHRFLMTVLAAITLASGVGTATVVNTAQPVQAISRHSYHWHKVHTTKKVKIIRVNAHKPRYKWRALETVTLPKNCSFKIRYFGNDNYFQLKDLGIEFSGTWIRRGSRANWFKNGYTWAEEKY